MSNWEIASFVIVVVLVLVALVFLVHCPDRLFK